MTSLAQRLIAAARDFKGAPWRHLGRTAAGLDCIGLVIVSARAAGLHLPDPGRYSREPTGQQLRQAAASVADRVELGAVEPGDVLVFNAGIYAAHVGIRAIHPDYLVPSVIHAFADRRAVVEERLDTLRPHLTGAFRLRET